MKIWDHGTRRIYENLSINFRHRTYLKRLVLKVCRDSFSVLVEDEDGARETFDKVISTAVQTRP